MIRDEQLSRVWTNLVEDRVVTEGMLDLVLDCFGGDLETALDKVIYARTDFSNVQEYIDNYGF